MVAKTKSAKTRAKTAPAKKTAAKKGTATKNKNVKKPAAARGGATREMNEETGFVVGSDQDIIANALLEGGESRAAIVQKLEKVLDTETRNGTPKQVTNMVSGVYNKLVARGFITESNFQVLPPTPASKRAATRAANKAAPAKTTKPAAKKTAAKKTSSAKSTTTKAAPKKTTKSKTVAKKGKRK
jgi:hypothetical protein